MDMFWLIYWKKAMIKRKWSIILNLYMRATFILAIKLTYVKGEDNQICLFGLCLFITYVPSLLPTCIVSTPLWETKNTHKNCKLLLTVIFQIIKKVANVPYLKFPCTLTYYFLLSYHCVNNYLAKNSLTWTKMAYQCVRFKVFAAIAMVW